MSDDFTAPPRRPAPEALEQRIGQELRAAERRTRQLSRVVAPIAAAAVLAGGVVVGTQLGRQQELVPAVSPSTSSSSGTTPSPDGSHSPTPRATTPAPSATPVVTPEVVTLPAMSKDQIRRDTKSCLAVDADEGQRALPRQGKLRTTYARVQPVIGNDTNASQRVLFLTDELGVFSCLDGASNGYASVSKAGRPLAVPGGIESADGGGSSADCGPKKDSVLTSDVMLAVDEERVATVRVTLLANRRPIRVVDLPVSGPSLYVGVRVTGPTAWLPVSVQTEPLTADGRTVAVQPARPKGTTPVRQLSLDLRSCAELVKQSQQFKPKPITRPTSDAAGTQKCRSLITKSAEGSFDVARATPQLTISTPTEWGTVLSDGRHYVGCSLFPTEEIGPVRSVTADPSVTKSLFYWAENPITPDGESLWAAGHLPGATAISYRLPNGTTSVATIDRDGYWMVKAHTATAFDREENSADWEPVTVTLTRRGERSTFRIPWTEDTSCNQVTHGC